MSQRLFHLMKSIDSVFVCDGQPTADRNTHWRQLKRHIMRMNDALDLVHTTLRVERELGISLSQDTARKIEGYARWPLAKIDGWGLAEKRSRR